MRSSGRLTLGLTRYFVLVSAVSMAALGLVLVLVTSDALREQSTRTAASVARDMMVDAVRPLDVDDLRAGTLSPTEKGAVDAAVQRFADRTVELRLWTTSRSLLYTTADRDSPPLPDPASFDQVLADGRIRTRATIDERIEPDGSTTTRPTLDVYIPVHARDVEAWPSAA
ncbi:MAG: hypothetical protein KJ792_05535, partial [Actinobacteria bacterium]|nr:hypothetical protein [Actinomycetota bacterium]MCG2803643.1 hypothetical protein [Cellulomonas sp.]